MKAQAAFGRAARVVVLDAIPFEDLDAAIIHANRQSYVHFSHGFAQHGVQGGIELEHFRRRVELRLSDGEQVRLAITNGYRLISHVNPP